MAMVEVLVPQMGEGLTEVRILEFQKQPGDQVQRDELLYSMETDKATLDVESPFEGVLREWLAQAGTILSVGAPVARIEVSAESAASLVAEDRPGIGTLNGAGKGSSANGSRPPVIIPPRTRAYGKEKGLTEAEMLLIPAVTGKLMPADVDAYLADKGRASVEAQPDYAEYSLSAQQRTFAYRLRRSAQVVISGTIRRPVEWNAVREFVTEAREKGAEPRPTEFQTFAFCVAQTVREFPKFRSTLIGEEVVREFAHLNLGIAVARPNEELTTAVVPNADTLDFPAFVTTAQAKIQSARTGEDQVEADTQLLLTYLGATGIEDAIPVLVAPAVAILFLGAAFEQEGRVRANLVLTFDHRLIYGVEAAKFLNSVAERIAQWQVPNP